MKPSDYWKQVREVCDAKSKGAWWLSEHDGSIQSSAGHVSDNDMSDGDEAFVVIASEALPLAIDEIERLRTALASIESIGSECPFMEAEQRMARIARAALGKP